MDLGVALLSYPDHLDVSRHAGESDGLPQLRPPLGVEPVSLSRDDDFSRSNRFAACDRGLMQPHKN